MPITVPEGHRNALTRLAAMPGKTRVAGALAVVAAAVAISACGSSSTSDQTIDPADAQTLNSALSGVELAVASGNCKKAQTEAQSFVDAVNGLPDTVGTANKEALRSAGTNLEKQTQDKSQCRPSVPTGTTDLGSVEPTTTPTTVPTTTATTTATTTSEPPSGNGGGNQGNGQGGGPPSTPPGQTGGGGSSGGGSSGGGSTGGGGGTGSGGTGGTGVGGGGGGTG